MMIFICVIYLFIYLFYSHFFGGWEWMEWGGGCGGYDDDFEIRFQTCKVSQCPDNFSSRATSALPAVKEDLMDKR